ncbi:hypothetical protein SAMN04488093_105126 [Tropicibacter naphthalenivorans]|uniref:Gene transfer agent protein n=2 Tax=Tropicibacter naphthalenivorans TaxID=441103 RepID=A0A0P1GEQ5_9RHOB|nr:hypothetical protein [Tropicibacter naphthalenivorans]CUH80178.1 hypothetical protein TRN7648_02857 [Tropicibacter naphthalenivorans]SMC85431.1 hypothetical protein SAMN04488093_105126 [Tropicibacter naphthalenivorans]
MSELRPRSEAFACAPAMRLEAHERVSKLHVERLEEKLARLEELMERLEKRLWLAVYGVVGAILAQAFQGLLSVTP